MTPPVPTASADAVGDVKRKVFTADDFRAELTKIMPGYKWTVHRATKGAVKLVATGIQSSGFNRLSTLHVERVMERDRPWYKVKSAGFGTRALWRTEVGDLTLARALRCLQDHYVAKCNSYRSLAGALQNGRAAAPPDTAPHLLSQTTQDDDHG